MNSRKNHSGAQGVSRKTLFSWTDLKDHISSARLDLYLQLRTAVIGGFVEHARSNRHYYELLSNTLLDMDEMYRDGSP